MTNKVRADPMIVVSPPTANNEYNNNRQVESAFVYRLNLTPVEKLQIAVMSVTVAPIRMLAATTMLICGWLTACIGLIGLRDSRLNEGPLTGWRRTLQNMIYAFGRAMFFCMGIHKVTVKGKQARPNEAPILVIAPHSSFVDPLILCVTDAIPVAKAEFRSTPFFSQLTRFTQVLLVQREKEQSRRDTRSKITSYAENVKASRRRDQYRQLLLFPEGTTTNGRALIHFKLGAFQNGVGIPVQPVVMRYRNKPDTLTWTWDQKYGMAGCAWLTMCQFNTRAEVEYLPVYTPSEEEAGDPRLFARNVRKIMADSLGVEVTDARFEDGKVAAAGSRETVNTEEVEMDSPREGAVDVDKAEEDLRATDVTDFDPSKMGYNYVDFAGNLTLVA